MSDRGLKSDAIPRNEPSSAGLFSSTRRGERPRRHLNPRAALVVAAFVLVAVPGFLLLKKYQDQHQRSALLAEAKRDLDQKQPNLALTYLNRYLELNPDDLDALDLKSRILFDVTRTPEQADAAIKVHDQVVRNDPRHKRTETLRRLVRLNLMVERIQTAHTLAAELLEAQKPSPPAQDYRLVGLTLMVLGSKGVEKLPKPGGEEVNVWDEATKNYEEANRIDPSNVEGARNLAYLYDAKRGDLAKAQQVLDRLLEHSKTAADRAAAHSALFEFYSAYQPKKPEESKLKEGFDKRAQAELAEAVRLKPDDPDIQLKAAINALRRGNSEEARQHVEAVPSQTRPELAPAIKGEVEWSEQNFDAAIQDWREGLKITGGTSELLTWRLAYVLLRLGRIEQAKPLVEQYHRLTDRAERPPKGLFLDALMEYKENRPAKAIPILEAIRLKLEDRSNDRGLDTGQSLAAEATFTLGQCYEANDQDDKALEAYRQATRIVVRAGGLRWADPWLGAAGVLTRAAKLDDAVNELKAGLAAVPNDPNLLVNLSRVLFVQQLQRPKDQRSWMSVQQHLDEARRVAPNSADPIKLQVAYLVTEGRLGEAANLLTEATHPKHPSRDPDVWALRAEVLRRLRQFDQAMKVLDEATNLLGEQASLWISRGQILSAQGRDKAAYDVLAEGAQRVPLNQRGRLWKALGDLHRGFNDMGAARQAYAQWAKLAPNDPQPHLLLLELALTANDRLAVQAAMASAKKLGGMTAELAQALVLLRQPPAQDKSARKTQLAKAFGTVNSLVKSYPNKPVGYLLQGQLLEMQAEVDENADQTREDIDRAIKAYKDARDHGGGIQALRPLFALMARQRRWEDLKRLQASLYPDEVTPELEQLAAGIALATGEKEMAQAIAQRLLKSDPQSLSTNIWEAQFLNNLGKPQEAEQILQNLIQARPTALEPRVALLFLEVNQKQFDKAGETVEQIRNQVKTERPEFVWAGCYWAIGNLPKATEYYKVALEKWPDDQDVRDRAVAFFLASGRRDDAEAMLRKILQREPNHGWARRELAQLLSIHREDLTAWNEAIKLTGATEAKDDTDEDRLVRATVLARSPEAARRQDAIPILEKLIAGNPGALGTQASDLLARIYLASDQLDKALAQARAAAGPGSSADQIAFYTELLLRAKQLDEARKQVDRLKQMEPNSLRVLELVTRTLQAQGKMAEATTLLEQTFSTVDKMPNGELVARKVLELLVALNQLKAAEKIGDRLAKLWPRNAWLHGQILARLGKLGDALRACRLAVDAGSPLEGGTAAATLINAMPPGADFNTRLSEADAILTEALKQLPDNTPLLFARTNVLRLQGRYAEAVKIYRTLLDRNPQNYVVLNNMAWTLSEDLNQPTEAIDRIDAAIQLAGRDPSFLDTRGVILTRLGKFDQAISDLQAAVQLARSPTAYYHLARAYSRAGRTGEFRKARDEAKQAGLTTKLLDPSERPEMERLMNP